MEAATMDSIDLPGGCVFLTFCPLSRRLKEKITSATLASQVPRSMGRAVNLSIKENMLTSKCDAVS
jgi:hypothetical protein